MEQLNPKVEIIRWVDSSIQNAQVDHHDYPKLAVITSVGWVVDVTTEHIILARDDMKDGEFRGLICIPQVCILPNEPK